MAATTLHIKTDTAVRDKATKVAESFGISLSTLVNRVLDQVGRTKKIDSDLLDEIPSKWMIEQMRKADEDIKAGRVIRFKSPTAAIKYFRELADADETTNRSHH
ncbi:hypothetical protein GCM10023321_25970 [Pseudonocardia eucalypti]|uniref:DNA-damage-inducible protein J n=1 Tax=Pseudonocardia eucalypti TaxID=648755 RepID=A0ABP9PYN5_9PSEU|nr:antitoxin component of RelBE/YafQ-DinJ toxin-antitoxin module [Pseudonocardia eucalypti]